MLKQIYELARDAFIAWNDDGAQALAAALAYYTLFSMAPVLIIAIAIAGLVFGQAAAERELATQLESFLGPATAAALQQVILNASQRRPGGMAILAAGALLLGASASFGQLQHALNYIWRDYIPRRRGLRHTLLTRAISVGMILGAGLLLLVSLFTNALYAFMSRFPAAEPLISSSWKWLNHGFSLVISLALFAFTFQALPRLKLKLSDVWIGALLTALLFDAGKYLISLYLGRSGMISIYGAAGSLIVLLIWVYYSAQILYFGAEFTKVYACRYGSLARRNSCPDK